LDCEARGKGSLAVQVSLHNITHRQILEGFFFEKHGDMHGYISFGVTRLAHCIGGALFQNAERDDTVRYIEKKMLNSSAMPDGFV